MNYRPLQDHVISFEYQLSQQLSIVPNTKQNLAHITHLLMVSLCNIGQFLFSNQDIIDHIDLIIKCLMALLLSFWDPGSATNIFILLDYKISLVHSSTQRLCCSQICSSLFISKVICCIECSLSLYLPEPGYLLGHLAQLCFCQFIICHLHAMSLFDVQIRPEQGLPLSLGFTSCCCAYHGIS